MKPVRPAWLMASQGRCAGLLALQPVSGLAETALRKAIAALMTLRWDPNVQRLRV